MRFCWLFCKMKKKIFKMKKKNWEMKKNPASQHRFCWAKWRKRFSKWRKKFSKWRKFFFILPIFLNYTKKTHKLKKAICTFIFTFIQCSNLFLLFKNFKKVHSGVSNGHSGVSKWALGPFKITHFVRDFKIGPLAHFETPSCPFETPSWTIFKIFFTARKNFLIEER